MKSFYSLEFDGWQFEVWLWFKVWSIIHNFKLVVLVIRIFCNIHILLPSEGNVGNHYVSRCMWMINSLLTTAVSDGTRIRWKSVSCPQASILHGAWWAVVLFRPDIAPANHVLAWLSLGRGGGNFNFSIWKFDSFPRRIKNVYCSTLATLRVVCQIITLILKFSFQNK